MRKLLIVCVAICIANASYASEKKVNLIPARYNLTLDEAMRQVSSDRLLVNCREVNTFFDKNGVAYGICGDWSTTRTFQIFTPCDVPAYSRPSKYRLKWYSGQTGKSDQGQEFEVNSGIGLDHIHVSLYRDDRLFKTGNYYLRVVPKTKDKTIEVYKPIGKTKRLVNTFTKGTSAEMLFQLASADEIKVKTGVKVGIEVVEAEASSEVAHADITTKSVKVGTTDDGKSLMIPTIQKMLVLTISETTSVDRAGNATRRVSLKKTEELFLEIKKIRPDSKGEYKWQSK